MHAGIHTYVKLVIFIIRGLKAVDYSFTILSTPLGVISLVKERNRNKEKEWKKKTSFLETPTPSPPLALHACKILIFQNAHSEYLEIKSAIIDIPNLSGIGTKRRIEPRQL